MRPSNLPTPFAFPTPLRLTSMRSFHSAHTSRLPHPSSLSDSLPGAPSTLPTLHAFPTLPLSPTHFHSAHTPRLLHPSSLSDSLLGTAAAPFHSAHTPRLPHPTPTHFQALLPRVAEAHAPFHGFRAGDVINDHDAALHYVLEHHPDALPSFGGLSPELKRLVLFTQSRMSFNHGWLVQVASRGVDGVGRVWLGSARARRA